MSDRDFIRPKITDKNSGIYGHVDFVNSEGIGGWLIDVISPEPRVVEVYVNDEKIGEAIANLLRLDIASIIGREANYGFFIKCSQLNVPSRISLEDNFEVVVIDKLSSREIVGKHAKGRKPKFFGRIEEEKKEVKQEPKIEDERIKEEYRIIKEEVNMKGILNRDTLITLWWTFHPRFKFIKTLKFKSKILDIGAGPGGLIFWKDWDWIHKRSDLSFFAVDIVKGENFEKYEDFQICDLEKDTLKWPNEFFDAAFLSHVIEHLRDVKNLLDNIDKKLKKDYAMLYVEFPSYTSIAAPSFELFLKAGIKESLRTTINFYDDGTHINLFNRERLKDLFMQIGFFPIEEGIICNSYIEDLLITYGIEHGDKEVFTYGLWSKLGFAEYIIFRRGSSTKNLTDLMVNSEVKP